MSEPRRCESEPKRGGFSTMSRAAAEAFQFLNAGMRKQFRGWGDTRTAARDRAANEAGVTPAQATRIWKHWQSMKSVDGDVYRLLRNAYEGLCERTEAAADALEARRLRRSADAVSKGRAAADRGTLDGRD